MHEALTYKDAVRQFLEAVPSYRKWPDNRLDHLEVDPINGAHVVFAGITRFLIDEFRAKRIGPKRPLEAALRFMESAITSGDGELENLVWVSFLENLRLAGPDYDALKARLGPALSAALREIESQEAH